MRRTRLGRAGLAAALALACAPAPTRAPRPFPVVPATFANNLLTAEHCHYRGPVTSFEEAKARGANLVLSFDVEKRQTVQGWQDEGTTDRFGPLVIEQRGETAGKAVRCPDDIRRQILHGEVPR